MPGLETLSITKKASETGHQASRRSTTRFAPSSHLNVLEWRAPIDYIY